MKTEQLLITVDLMMWAYRLGLPPPHPRSDPDLGVTQTYIWIESDLGSTDSDPGTRRTEPQRFSPRSERLSGLTYVMCVSQPAYMISL